MFLLIYCLYKKKKNYLFFLCIRSLSPPGIYVKVIQYHSLLLLSWLSFIYFSFLTSINRSIVYVFLTLYVLRILCQFLNTINYIHVCILMFF